MKLKELKAYINALPKELEDCEVILQKDAEGNGYSPLSEVDENCVYVPETTWHGEVYNRKFSAEDMCMEEKEWKKLRDDPKKRAVVLCPVN